MHFNVLVTGENVAEALLPHLAEVEPFEEFLEQFEIIEMAKEVDLSPIDLAALALKMEEWDGSEGFIKEGRLGRITTTNLKAHLDWFQIGGMFANSLQLLKPRKRKIFGFFPLGSTKRATAAKKYEIDLNALCKHPPAALLTNGQWLDEFNDPKLSTGDNWAREFVLRLAQIPEDTLLTVVDAHH
jgi:hypothetical protein